MDHADLVPPGRGGGCTVPDVTQTDVAAATELASSLQAVATGANNVVTPSTCDVALGPAAAGVAAATGASMALVQRLADRCQTLSVGVELAAQQTVRADRF